MRPKRYPYQGKIKEPAMKQVLNSKDGLVSILLGKKLIQFQK